MFKWWRRKKTDARIVNLATVNTFDDEIEGFSGIIFIDEPFTNDLAKSITPTKSPNSEIKDNEEQELKQESKDVNNIHYLVQNARHQINKYKEKNNVNEHENLLERLEQLKNLCDSSQIQPNEFQQMLNRIKERNFNDRMTYIMERIKIFHRDDDKLELNQNGEPLEVKKNNKVGKKNKITITGDKEEITSLKQKLPNNPLNNIEEKDNLTITLSVEQFQQVVRDTVEDVLVELGIKNKDE
ncbi:hypothetical protein [Spiroplasma endosymbiont of Polydrusus pterygomalis]|uniref:hypothetical protein n=1 Tax=Spiroplasma endosymbiont of Polydrusus pterygomalis TaxID=3139327 RepID=UPI003CCAD54C